MEITTRTSEHGKLTKLHVDSVRKIKSRLTRYTKGSIFVCFLFSGHLKNIAYFQTIAIDLTIIFGTLTIIAIFYSVFIKGVRLSSGILWVLALHVLCAIPIFWTAWSGYAEQKVLRMFTITLLAAISPFFLLREKKDVDAFFKCIILFAAFIAFDAATNWRAGTLTYERLMSFGSIISFGRIMAFASLWFIVMAISNKRFISAIYVSLSSIFIVFMVGAGARGPVVAFSIAFIIILWISIRLRRRIFFLLVLLGIITLVTFNAITIVPRTSQQRIKELFTGEAGFGKTLRADYYPLAIYAIGSNPAGIGWGGFEKIATGSFQKNVNRVYPHNLILEAFLEGGWAVGVFLCAFIYTVLSRAWRQVIVSPSRIFTFSLAFLVFLLVSVLFSNDWNDSRDFFALLSIVMVISKNELNPHQAIRKA